MHQLKEKTKKYATTLAQEGLKLRVLAFTPTGRIHPESMLFARGLAKQAGKPFDEFWAPVCTEVMSVGSSRGATYWRLQCGWYGWSHDGGSGRVRRHYNVQRQGLITWSEV